MPLIGLSSFLRIIKGATKNVKCCVNALNRAFLISTIVNMPENEYYKEVSMPLIGLSSFLQEQQECEEVPEMCQCP